MPSLEDTNEIINIKQFKSEIIPQMIKRYGTGEKLIQAIKDFARKNTMVDDDNDIVNVDAMTIDSDEDETLSARLEKCEAEIAAIREELKTEEAPQPAADQNDVSLWSDEKIALAIKLGVVFEFSDDGEYWKLDELEKHDLSSKSQFKTKTYSAIGWNLCRQSTLPNRVRMHDGGACPVSTDAWLCVMYKNVGKFNMLEYAHCVEWDQVAAFIELKA